MSSAKDNTNKDGNDENESKDRSGKYTSRRQQRKNNTVKEKSKTSTGTKKNKTKAKTKTKYSQSKRVRSSVFNHSLSLAYLLEDMSVTLSNENKKYQVEFSEDESYIEGDTVFLRTKYNSFGRLTESDKMRLLIDELAQVITMTEEETRDINNLDMWVDNLDFTADAEYLLSLLRILVEEQYIVQQKTSKHPGFRKTVAFKHDLRMKQDSVRKDLTEFNSRDKILVEGLIQLFLSGYIKDYSGLNEEYQEFFAFSRGLIIESRTADSVEKRDEIAIELYENTIEKTRSNASVNIYVKNNGPPTLFATQDNVDVDRTLKEQTKRIYSHNKMKARNYKRRTYRGTVKAKNVTVSGTKKTAEWTIKAPVMCWVGIKKSVIGMKKSFQGGKVERKDRSKRRGRRTTSQKNKKNKKDKNTDKKRKKKTVSKKRSNSNYNNNYSYGNYYTSTIDKEDKAMNEELDWEEKSISQLQVLSIDEHIDQLEILSERQRSGDWFNVDSSIDYWSDDEGFMNSNYALVDSKQAAPSLSKLKKDRDYWADKDESEVFHKKYVKSLHDNEKLSRDIERVFKQFKSQDRDVLARQGRKIDNRAVQRRLSGDKTVKKIYRKRLNADTGKRLICLLVDASGSMDMDEVKTAVDAFKTATEQMNDNILIITFRDESVHLVKGPRENYEYRYLNSMPEGGGTPLPLGLITARKVLSQERSRQKILVTITDGRPNESLTDKYSTGDPVDDSAREVREARRERINTIAFAAGDVDKSAMNQIYGRKNVVDIRIDDLSQELMKVYKNEILDLNR